MTYLQKEEQIIKKLAETNYAAVEGNKKVAFDFISGSLSSFPDYAQTVIGQETQMRMLNVMYSGEEFRDRTQTLDQTRRNAHNNAIGSINALNRFCKNLGLEPFADINTNDRHAVAEFVGDYVNEVYREGISSGPQQELVKERLADIDRRFGHIINQKDEQEEGLSY